jgi:hypothetical protein
MAESQLIPLSWDSDADQARADVSLFAAARQISLHFLALTDDQ